MSENLDSDTLNEGTPKAPPLGGSQEGSDSLNSNAGQPKVDVDSFTRELAEVKKQLRSLQGDKDRGVAQTRREVDELKRKLAEVEKLKKRGFSEDDAFEELELREQLRSLRTAPAGNGESEAFDKAETLKEYGLDENDPDVASALSGKNIRSALELENVALKVALKKANKPAPDPSAAPSANGHVSKPDEMESLKKAYDTELKELTKGRPSPALISELKSKYRRKGLEVW